ncbi:IS481 family transposase [Streptomyces daghestanicus]|uniref:IS481 family transposase n=1 Tax=Streptomyces daghestanicus TaxID=66885 RepID=A0ABQ3PUN1_9ACTN|nr:IS481 family transposase [Streptomyces daghestanicus]GHI28727.1 IS481 family transposase [Streptomyces daghestanicus]
MSHRNAPLTPTGRLRPARCVVDDGRPLRRAAERFQVSHTTAARWASRCRQAGEAGMRDRSSRPHHSPRRTPDTAEQQAVRLRREHRIGPVRPAARCGIAPSTAHRIPSVTTCPPRPRRTGPQASPSAATNTPARANPSTSTSRNSAASPTAAVTRSSAAQPAARTAPAPVPPASTPPWTITPGSLTPKIPPDEKAATCAAFLIRATAWFAARGITVERALTDNAWAHTTNTCRDTCQNPGIRPRRTQPWRPQTNGKAERFHRTLLEEWAHIRPYTSDRERQAAFPDWPDRYNYHRPHTGIHGHPPSRVTNLPGQHT